MRHASFFAATVSTLILLLVAGCSTPTTPKTYYYLIAPDYQASAALSAPTDISVECAPFLSQGGLVVENSDQTIVTAHYHRWAEPLPSMISRYLQRRLQSALRPEANPPAITLLIDRFHRLKNGTVIYSGQWWTQGKSPQPFSYREQPTSAGYDGTVASLHHLLDQQALTLVDALAPDTLAQTDAP
nr:ABC-type transport auxiliary lipoprotein family protein [uncultured Desulfuromonas sp.]